MAGLQLPGSFGDTPIDSIPLGLGAIKALPALGWAQILLFCSALEILAPQKEDKVPGNVQPDTESFKVPGDVEIRTKEINNGGCMGLWNFVDSSFDDHYKIIIIIIIPISCIACMHGNTSNIIIIIITTINDPDVFFLCLYSQVVLPWFQCWDAGWVSFLLVASPPLPPSSHSPLGSP